MIETKEQLQNKIIDLSLKLRKASNALKKEPLLDRVSSKIISRKFLTFVIATILMVQANLESDTWGMIAMIYIGSQSVVDAALAWRHGK